MVKRIIGRRLVEAAIGKKLDAPTSFGAYLKDCRLCVECDFVFEKEDHCPKCGSVVFMPLSRWLQSKGAPVE